MLSTTWTKTVTVPAWSEISPSGDTYGQTLKATLVWTDHSGQDLVNRLGLAVIAQSGNQSSRRHGNYGDVDMTSHSQTYDPNNNTQQVKWNNCPAGNVTMTVTLLQAAQETVIGTEKVGFAVVWSLE